MDISQDNLANLEADVQDCILSGDVVTARDLMTELWQAGVSAEQASDQATLYRRLMFARLAQITEEECIWLFENFIFEGLTIPDFDLLKALDNRFLMILGTEDRAAFLEKIQKAVERSQVLLGDKGLIIDKKEVPPTVASWLKDYIFTPAQGEYRQSIDELEYVNRGKSASVLTADERALLLQLLRIYDSVRNSVLQYQRAPVTYIEDLPSLSYDLIRAKVDDFDTPEQAAAAFKLLEQQVSTITTPPPTKPAVGTPTTGRFAATPSFAQKVEANSGPRPNIQGVLSNAPIKKETVQVEKSMPINQSAAPVAQVQSQTKPTQAASPSKPVLSTQMSTPKPPVSSGDGPAKVVVGKAPLPARVPDNLPMVEPEDLPAVVQAKASKQSFAKPIAPAPKAQAQNLPPTLNMNKIQAEVARKKEVAQSDIDQRLANLKKRSANKN